MLSRVEGTRVLLIPLALVVVGFARAKADFLFGTKAGGANLPLSLSSLVTGTASTLAAVNVAACLGMLLGRTVAGVLPLLHTL